MDKELLERAKKEGMVVLPSVPQGWECPKCGAVMNPNREVCVNCTGKHKAATYTSLINNFDDLAVTGNYQTASKPNTGSSQSIS